MNASIAETAPPKRKRQSRRAFWFRTMIQWHWISSAICLVGMILFAVTGITLNHAAEIETIPKITNRTAQIPSDLVAIMNENAADEKGPLPSPLVAWLDRELDATIGSRPAEWSDYEVYISMPGPGSDAWLAIDRETGEVEFEGTSRGWIAYFNDLHKGRNTGVVWKWFLDLFSVSTLIFCTTGLFLLYFHARHRRMTWPLVGLGFVLPMLLAIWAMH